MKCCYQTMKDQASKTMGVYMEGTVAACGIVNEYLYKVAFID